jgi:carboxymethylenebutenolidase
MRMRLLFLVLAAASLTAGGHVVLAQHAGHSGMRHAHSVTHGGGITPITSAFALPTPAATRTLLEGAVHTSEFVNLGAGAVPRHAFVSYPDRPDRAPALIVTTGEGMTDWARATAFQGARAGFIGIVADDRGGPGGGAEPVTAFASRNPAANGTIARVDIRNDRITAIAGSAPAATFAVNDEGWSSALRFLSEQTGNRFEPLPQMDHVAMEMRARQAGRAGQGQQGGRGAGPARTAPGLNVKPDDLPANWVMAEKVVATTPRKNEWIDVPVPGTNVKVHTWVVYPAGDQKAGAVLVLAGASGTSDWVRGVADQLAKEGFIALAVDLSSGLGPNGGNYDSFRFVDDSMRATQTLGRDAVMARIKAVRDHAAKMPRSNGRTGSIGFCGGGTNSFTLATDVPEHNASVTYYGAAPPAASLAKANAPVLGFYGEDDARIFTTVEPTRAEMKRLGKSYEAHTYPHATHSFLWMQDLGNNFQATADSWPRTIAFYRLHLNTPAPPATR